MLTIRALNITLASLAGATAMLGCANGADLARPASTVDPCDVIADPAKYADREVTLDGVFFTDWREYSGMKFPACSAKFLPFRFTDRKVEGGEAMEQALTAVRPNPAQRDRVNHLGKKP